MNDHDDIHHHVTQLTRTHTIQAAYHTFTDGELRIAYHYTKAPALITQLQHATPSSSGEASAGGYQSRPAARIDSLDTLIHIDTEAAAWIRFLGHDDPGTTIACVTRLGSLYPSAPEASKKAIERAIKAWWNQARITTGYDSPAWRPDNTCPLCNEKGSLRVKLATHTALCVNCREVWDGTTIALLADHIRDENAEDQDELTDATPDEAA